MIKGGLISADDKLPKHTKEKQSLDSSTAALKVRNVELYLRAKGLKELEHRQSQRKMKQDTKVKNVRDYPILGKAMSRQQRLELNEDQMAEIAMFHP